ncbi:MAG: holo-[acyl-carrier-protein] synthase [Chloroflexi bacterium]|nr:MAG: holo-[acyl-carrier-protein] synthase [Chloroflexota bacterium]
MINFQTADLIGPSVRTGDATGNHLIEIARILRQDGIRTQIYSNYPPGPTPDDIRPLVRQTDYAGYSPQSDLFILEYPSWYPLAERIRDTKGATLFAYHGVTPPELWKVEAGREQMEISQLRTQLAWFAHLAIADSPYIGRELHNLSGYPMERIRIIPISVPVDTIRQRPSEATLAQLRAQWRLEGKQVMLFIGRVAGNKRIDAAVAALARLRTSNPVLHLLVVGSKEDNPAERELAVRLADQAARLGVADRVTLTGRVDAVEPYLHLADVVVLPSQHEGFGVPLVEAMAAGTPVVAGATGAMPWVLDAEKGEERAAGLLCKPGDAEDLARQVQRLLTDAELRATLVERGYARAAAFSPAVFAHNLRTVLAEAAELAKEPPPAAQSPMGRLMRESDIALRSYRVRSGSPIVGRLIEWVRRNSTTHVKEAYLDPIIERQVNYNRLLADEILKLQMENRRLRAANSGVRTGVDLIEIARIRTAVERYGAHFLERVFTAAERAACNGRTESLAARFAGKEAVAKALGTGIWRHGITWTDIEIVRVAESGEPALHLHGAAAVRAAGLGLGQWSISLSHDRERAIAVVVGQGGI